MINATSKDLDGYITNLIDKAYDVRLEKGC
jgi:hypothetical protein